MNYSVTGEQLTGIADAIRAKKAIDPSEPYASLGKNLLDPDKMYVEGLPKGHYTFSMKALESSESAVYYEYFYGTQPNYEGFSGFEAGDRLSFVINVAATGVKITFANDQFFTDYQLESGDEATSFEPYVIKLMFPEGFEEGISLLTDTRDADATAGDIVSGKTAYVDGIKVTGNLVPIDTSDATATASDIASGKTAYANGSKVTGTYKNYNGVTIETVTFGRMFSTASDTTLPTSKQSGRFVNNPNRKYFAISVSAFYVDGVALDMSKVAYEFGTLDGYGGIIYVWSADASDKIVVPKNKNISCTAVAYALPSQ